MTNAESFTNFNAVCDTMKVTFGTVVTQKSAFA